MAGIYVVTEHQQPDELDDVTFELLAAGREVADGLGEDLVAVALGDDPESYADDLGAADSVLAVEDGALAQFSPVAYADAVEAVVESEDPSYLLTSVTSLGLDVASRVAGDTDTPLVSYVTDVDVNGGDLTATSQLYGGKMNLDSEFEDGSGMLAVSTGAFEPVEVGGDVPVDTLSVDVSEDGVRFIELNEPEVGDVDIAQEDRLLSIGRGIDDEENIPMAEDVARELDAALASSRPLIDNGWMPKNRQVGKSGKSVSPELYVAAGISGAPEHIEGMEGSDTIVAVNTDPEAPIFDYADYGIVADLFDVFPAMEEQL